MSVSTSFRHGLITQRLISRIAGLGVTINPYYLFQEARPQSPPDHPGDDFVSEVLRPEEVASAAACAPWANNLERFEERLARGHLCIVVKEGGTIAGYTWADTEEVNDSACDYPLQRGDAYLYDAYIGEGYRGRGLAPFMRVSCYDQLHDRGIKRFFSISDYFNTPAIRFKEKLDARPILLYLQIKIGGRQLGQWILKDFDRRH